MISPSVWGTTAEWRAPGIRPSKQMVRYLRMAMDPDQADALLADLGLPDLKDAEKGGNL